MENQEKPTKGRLAFEFVSPNGIPDGDELHVQHTGALVLYTGGGRLWSIIGSEKAERLAIEILRARGRWPE
jgi:hypothetical protein